MLEVQGDLVITSGDALWRAVTDELDAGGRRIVLDLDRLTHVDTPGLALLLHLHRACDERGAAFVVAAMPEAFSDIVEHLRLAEELRLAPTVAAALDG